MPSRILDWLCFVASSISMKHTYYKAKSFPYENSLKILIITLEILTFPFIKMLRFERISLQICSRKRLYLFSWEKIHLSFVNRYWLKLVNSTRINLLREFHSHMLNCTKPLESSWLKDLCFSILTASLYYN